MRDYAQLSSFLEKNGLNWTEGMQRQFDCYYDRLTETNKVMNLTAITDFSEVVEKHFLDSAALLSVVDLSSISTVIDIGTGAGFPGLVLKILFPHLKIVLADSLQKRIRFLNSLIEELKLSDISALHGRAEDLGRNKLYREQFDLCVSRAVAPLPVLSELCLPFVRVNGTFVPFKSSKGKEELEEAQKAITLLSGKVQSVEEFEIGSSSLLRCFPVIIKTKQTPGRFPRKAGTPSKEPIM